MQDNTDGPEMPALLAALWELLAGAQARFGQERVFRRAVALLLAELFALGRHTVTQLLRTLGAVGQDWSAWYRLFSRGRFDPASLGEYLLEATLPHGDPAAPYVVTVDGVGIPRSGRHVAGSSWAPARNTAPFRRGLARAQRFVEVAWLTPVEHSYCRAIPLRWLPAPTEKAVPAAVPPCKEWAAGLAALRWVRAQLDRLGRAAQALVGVLDGNYDTQEIWKALPARTTLLVRCAKNRALYALPPAGVGPRTPGRPILYGDRQPTPRQWLRSRKQQTPLTLVIRGRARHLRYRVLGPVLVEGAPHCPLFLVGVAGHTRRRGARTYRRQPVYYLVNAVAVGDQWQLPFPVATLLAWAWQRWECEVAHRELKSTLGIGDKQCWSPAAALVAVQWGVWVYGLLVLAAYRTWGITGGPRRQGRWYPRAPRWSFATMWHAYQAALWGYTEFSPLYAPSLQQWLKTDLWRTALANALADPAPI